MAIYYKADHMETINDPGDWTILFRLAGESFWMWASYRPQAWRMAPAGREPEGV